MSWDRIAAALLVLVLAAPGHAQSVPGDTLTYRVRQGDTLDLVAAEFYGDRNLAIFIVVENKLQRAHGLRPGERLKVPVTREIVTAKGDTFESLAATYLGDAKRATFFADFNAMSPEASLATGTTLTVPFHVTHVATGSETLGSIAVTYFGDPKQAELLRRYNGLDKAALDKGESIVVPVMHVRVRPSKLPPLDAESKLRRDQQQKAVAAAAIALPAARAAWLEGDFAGVKAALAQFGEKLDFLDAAEAVEVGLLLGKASVAYGDTGAAVALFTEILNRQPRHELSTYAESPKVIAAWKTAGGHVDGQ